MKLFGFNKKPEDKFFITETDRQWVEESFVWLIKSLGLPKRLDKPILFTEIFFQKGFSDFSVENLLDDFSCLLDFNRGKVTINFQEDLRDTYGIPYEFEGTPFATAIEIVDGNYILYVAKSLVKQPKTLLLNLVKECVKVKLYESKLQFENGEDADLFLYVAGVYFGFGILISQCLKDIGFATDGFWETKWSNVSEMPEEIMAFALAIHSSFSNENREWKDELPKTLKIKFEQAAEYLRKYPCELLSTNRLEIYLLFLNASEEFEKQQIESAISIMQKTLFLTEDEQLKSEAYYAIGYFHLWIANFDKSISSLYNAIEVDPNFGYALSNLGYALIRAGELEKGKQFTERAMATEVYDEASIFRNLALYYFEKGDFTMAEESFLKAFDAIITPVDFLEFHYADYLLRTERKDEAMKYLQTAVEKKEPEAMAKWKFFSGKDNCFE